MGPDRSPNLGVEFSAPDVSGHEGYRLLPLGGGELNPKTSFNLWNPISAYDTIATYGRAFMPGINEAGQIMGDIGRSIADSDFGRAISMSPLAAAGQFAGEAVQSVFKGAFQTFGDLISPFGDIAKSVNDRDFGGTALNMLRAGTASGIREKLTERIQGMMRGDQKLTEELVDELGFVTTVATFGFGSASGLLGRGVMKALGPAAKMGLYDLGRQQASPTMLTAIHTANRALAVGYGLQFGGEIASSLGEITDDPEIRELNDFIASQRSIPEGSPFRGTAEFAVATLVDPLRFMGGLADTPYMRKFLDSGAGRLPAPAEMAKQYLLPGKQVMDDAFIANNSSKLVQQVARRRVEILNPGLTISDEALEAETRHLVAVARGEAGTAAEYTRLQADMRMELQRELLSTQTRRPEYNTRGMSTDDFIALDTAERRAWQKVSAVEDPLIANGMTERHLLVTHDTVTDKDLREVMEFLAGDPRISIRAEKAMPQAVMDELNKKFPRQMEMVSARTARGIYQSLEQTLQFLPREAHGLMDDVAKQVRGEGAYKVIVKGSRPLIKPGEKISRGHPAYRDLKRIIGPVEYSKYNDQVLTIEDMMDAINEAGKDSASILKWMFDSSAYYTHSRSGLTRPIIKPREDLAGLMPKGATKLGTYIAGVREWIPNMELNGMFQERFFNVHADRLGATRDQVEALLDGYRDLAAKNGVVHIGQAQTLNPATAGDGLQIVFENIFGPQASKTFRAGQLLEESMPRESWKDFIKILTGEQVGAVGLGPSIMSRLRAQNTKRAGDFYRWWAQVGHPMLRYDLSPTFQMQLPLESAVLNFLRGVQWAPVDDIVRKATNEMMTDIVKRYSGKTAGERMHGIGIMSSEAAATEITSSARLARDQTMAARVKYMEGLVAAMFPDYFAKTMKASRPQDWALLRKTFKTDRRVAEEVLKNRDAVHKFLRGEMTKEEMLDVASIVKQNYKPTDIEPLPARGEFDGNKSATARFNESRLQKEQQRYTEAGYRFTLPQKNLNESGWVASINVTRDLSDPVTKEIAEFLHQRGVRFKVGGNNDYGRGMTIYAGERDRLDGLAAEINKRWGKQIPEQRDLINGVTVNATSAAPKHTAIYAAISDSSAAFVIAGGRRLEIGGGGFGSFGRTLASNDPARSKGFDVVLKDGSEIADDLIQRIEAADGTLLFSRSGSKQTWQPLSGPEIAIGEVQSPAARTVERASGKQTVIHNKVVRDSVPVQGNIWARFEADGLEYGTQYAINKATQRFDPVDMTAADRTLRQKYGAYYSGSGKGFEHSGRFPAEPAKRYAPPYMLSNRAREVARKVGLFDVKAPSLGAADAYRSARIPQLMQRVIDQKGRTQYEGLLARAGGDPKKARQMADDQINKELDAIRYERDNPKPAPAKDPAPADRVKGDVRIAAIPLLRALREGQSPKIIEQLEKEFRAKRILRINADKWQWIDNKGVRVVPPAAGTPAHAEFVKIHKAKRVPKMTEAEVKFNVDKEVEAIYKEVANNKIPVTPTPPPGLPETPTVKLTPDLDEGISFAATLEKDAADRAIVAANAIIREVQSAMSDAIRHAQTVHISNPTRRYWERSFSHPVLVYPLSWTLKATGEWASFLASSMFGLKTGMGGLVLFDDIKDATIRALANDPDAVEWIEKHPATVKLIEYMIPGTPLGVGFGLLSMPLRNAIQLGWNYNNNRPLDENMSNIARIGAIRDVGPGGVAEKLWAEWVTGKPRTSVDNPGLTSGKKRHPQGIDKSLEPGFKELFENRR